MVGQIDDVAPCSGASVVVRDRHRSSFRNAGNATQSATCVDRISGNAVDRQRAAYLRGSDLVRISRAAPIFCQSKSG